VHPRAAGVLLVRADVLDDPDEAGDDREGADEAEDGRADPAKDGDRPLT
jgi:hypothetical protein